MVYLMLANGFEEIEALSVVDILRRGEIEIETVSVFNEEFVCGAHGIVVKTDKMFNEISEGYDMIVLPGGMPGTTNLQSSKELLSLLQTAYKSDKFIAAICAAPMILGELGMLESKKATSYPGFEKHLLNAELSIDNVCVDCNVITSRGAGTAPEFAFKLLELLKSKEDAIRIRSSMMYD